MIAANELRIGNWVKYNDKNETPIPIIIKIGLADLMLISEGVKDCEYNPIPLTPEILEKCGFVESDSKTKWGGHLSPEYNGGRIRIINNQWWNGCWQTEVKYLHQLQNLCYALTGEELQFNT